jgi:hypothetical protein
MASPRALRLGVLLGGNLVEERVISGASPITIGQSLRCTLSIPADGVPHEHTLFVHDQGRMLLRATPGMTGRLAAGETIHTEIAAVTPVTRGMRGKLQIGDATILFQEIATPPLVPRPVLPASIRGTLLGRVDKRLAVIIGGSLAVHILIGAWAWATETETPPLFQSETVAMYRHDTMEVSLPDLTPPTVTPTEPGPGAATPVTPVQAPRPIVDRPRITTNPRPDPGMSPAEAARLASILTGSDPGRTGPGEMRNRQPGADLRQQIDDVGTRQITIGDDGKGFRKEPGPRLGDGPGPIVDDPTPVSTQPIKTDNEVKGRITLRPLPPDGPGTTLTVDMVVDKIQTVYMPNLQRCYRKGLLGDASLAGKIALSFTVTERGGLDDIEAHGVSSEVDACVSTAMSTWRFPIPKDKDGDPTDQGFRLVLALQPS